MQDQSRKYSRPRTANRGASGTRSLLSITIFSPWGQKKPLTAAIHLIYSGLSGDWSKCNFNSLVSMAFGSLPVASHSQVQQEKRLGWARADQLLHWRQGGLGLWGLCCGPGRKWLASACLKPVNTYSDSISFSGFTTGRMSCLEKGLISFLLWGNYPGKWEVEMSVMLHFAMDVFVLNSKLSYLRLDSWLRSKSWEAWHLGDLQKQLIDFFQSKGPPPKELLITNGKEVGPSQPGSKQAFCVLTCNLSCKSVAFFCFCSVRLWIWPSLVLHWQALRIHSSFNNHMWCCSHFLSSYTQTQKWMEERTMGNSSASSGLYHFSHPPSQFFQAFRNAKPSAYTESHFIPTSTLVSCIPSPELLCTA